MEMSSISMGEKRLYLFLAVRGETTSGDGHELQQGKLQLERTKFHRERMFSGGAGAQRGCDISILRNIQQYT